MKKIISLVIVALLALSLLGTAVMARTGDGLDDGARNSVDDNLPSNSGLDDNGLRGDGSVDDNSVSGSGLDDTSVSVVRLSDGTSVEVGLGVPASAVTVERKNAAVQKALQAEPGSVQRVEVELENNAVVWKVRIMTSDNRRADIRVSDSSGAIVRSDISDVSSGSSSDSSSGSNSVSNSGSDDVNSQINLAEDNPARANDDNGFHPIVTVKSWFKAIASWFK